MNISKLARTFIATCTLTSLQASAAPILLLDGNNTLVGAKNVNVLGTLYDVTFVDGSCNSLFSHCDASTFTFTSMFDAAHAAQALLDQVFVDGPAGQFDSVAGHVFGCTNNVIGICVTHIPYTRFSVGPDKVRSMDVGNYAQGWAFDYGDSETYFAAYDTTQEPHANFALFTRAALPAADVPEPSSIALIGTALTALAFARRRRA